MSRISGLSQQEQAGSVVSSIAGVLASERTAIFCRKDLKERAIALGQWVTWSQVSAVGTADVERFVEVENEVFCWIQWETHKQKEIIRI